MIVRQSQRGISSDGRALALHVRGTGIDARILQPVPFVDTFSYRILKRQHFLCWNIDKQQGDRKHT